MGCSSGNCPSGICRAPLGDYRFGVNKHTMLAPAEKNNNLQEQQDDDHDDNNNDTEENKEQRQPQISARVGHTLGVRGQRGPRTLQNMPASDKQNSYDVPNSNQNTTTTKTNEEDAATYG